MDSNSFILHLTVLPNILLFDKEMPHVRLISAHTIFNPHQEFRAYFTSSSI